MGHRQDAISGDRRPVLTTSLPLVAIESGIPSGWAGLRQCRHAALDVALPPLAIAAMGVHPEAG
ncbi:MAG: hypothetical protein ABI604_02430 [Nitrospirota bacterium]